MKKAISMIMVLALVLSLGAVSYAAPVRASDESTAAQIQLLVSNFSDYRQNEVSGAWYYTVTDLDHNGRLELLAASEQGNAHYTYVRAWEVNETGDSVTPCDVNIPVDESFPDILAENADTYYNPADDSWSYLFYDNIVLSADEAYYVRCSVRFQEGELGFEQLAIEHMFASNGVMNTVYMDNEGVQISAEQYNDAGTVGTQELVRSSTNFEWVAAKDVSAETLADSYAVFKGVKQPSAKANEISQPAPTATQTASSMISISKNPTNESREAGGTAWFVAGASGYTSLVWTFVSPAGGEFTVQSFRNSFPGATVSGENGTTLTIAGLSTEMSGWSVYCTFYNNGQTARTNTAFLYVSAVQSGTVNSNPGYSNYYYSSDGNYSIYYGDGSYTTYCWDGSVLDVSANGIYTLTSPDGTVQSFDDNGSWTEYRSDGSWNIYDATTGQAYGGVNYDYNVPGYYSYYYNNSAVNDYTVYNGDGTWTTWYNDGGMLTWDSSDNFVYADPYGDITVYNSAGEWVDYNANGSWNAYDTNTGIGIGGLHYDLGDDQLLEIYSALYGWGSLYY